MDQKTMGVLVWEYIMLDDGKNSAGKDFGQKAKNDCSIHCYGNFLILAAHSNNS